MLTRIQLPEVDCKLFDHHFLERQGHKLLNGDDKQTSGMMTYPNLYYVDSCFFKKKIKFTDNKKSAEYSSPRVYERMGIIMERKCWVHIHNVVGIYANKKGERKRQ